MRLRRTDAPGERELRAQRELAPTSYLYVDVIVTMVVRVVTIAAELRVGQEPHAGWRNWWVGSPA